MRRASSLAAAFLLLTAGSHALADPAGDEAAIRERLTRWTAAFNAQDAVAACDLFAPDLVYTVPEISAGSKTTMCGNLAKVLSRTDIRLRYDAPDIHEVLVSGDIAVVRLTWTLTAETKRGSDVSTEDGIDIFRRQADGTWSIARFIAVSPSPNDALK